MNDTEWHQRVARASQELPRWIRPKVRSLPHFLPNTNKPDVRCQRTGRLSLSNRSWHMQHKTVQVTFIPAFFWTALPGVFGGASVLIPAGCSDGDSLLWSLCSEVRNAKGSPFTVLLVMFVASTSEGWLFLSSSATSSSWSFPPSAAVSLLLSICF